VGSAALADITAFSFYATKNLTTGEGGAAVTDDEALAERIRLLSLHGMSRDAWKRYGASGSWFYEITAPGWKYNLSDLLASIGVAQLERFEASQRRRHEIAAALHRGVRLGARGAHAGHASGHDARLAPVRDRPRARAPAHRPRPLHRGAARREHRHQRALHPHPHAPALAQHARPPEGSLPVAEDAFRRAITLPLFAQDDRPRRR
jgi:perosamine synthetase